MNRIAITSLLCLAAACSKPPAESKAVATSQHELKRSVLQLTRDVRTDREGTNLSLDTCVENGSRTFCVLWDPFTGTELWVSDGTAAGTHVVADLEPGEQGYVVPSLAVMNGEVYFVAVQRGANYRVFRTDGTAANTVALPSEGDLTWVTELAAVGNTLFISGQDEKLGFELWKTDGKSAPVLVKDISPGVNSSQPRRLTPVGNKLMFLAQEPTTGLELYVSDGTSTGTKLVKDLTPSSSSFFDWNAAGNDLVVLNDVLIFRHQDSTNGRELWRSDGTANGTYLIKDINPGAAHGLTSDTKTLTRMGNAVYFMGITAAEGAELWKTDGTAAGTVMVKDIDAVPGGSYPYNFSAAGDRLYFFAYTAAEGREPWVSDGTTDGTVRLADINPGVAYSHNGSSTPLFYALGSNKVVFAAKTEASGTEPWVTDGTPAGTKQLKELTDGTAGSISWSSLSAFSAGGRVVFAADDGMYGQRWYTTDGTEGGTTVLLDPTSLTASLFPYETLSLNTEPLIPFHDKVLFFADAQDDKGMELYVSDGTESGTTLVKDIKPGSGSGVRKELPDGIMMNGVLLFSAAETDNNWELWQTDGTEAGTSRLADIEPGPGGSAPRFFTFCNGYVYFMASRSDVGVELFRTDGTAAGTTLVKDLVSGTGSSIPYQFSCVNNRLAFVASTESMGRELWVSDGTPNGTVPVDLAAGAADSEPRNFTVAGDFVYFVANSNNGAELYRVKPTISAPELVRDLVPGIDSPFANFDPKLTAVGNKVFFIADVAPYGKEVWVTDGTPEGTRMVRDVNPGAAQSEPQFLTAVGNKLFWKAFDPLHGEELWVSQGTPSTTQLVKDIYEGPVSGVYQSNFLALDSETLLFSGVDAQGGVELWRSRGTEETTQRVEDVVSGPGSLQPFSPVKSTTRVYFKGLTREHGRELWTGLISDLTDHAAPTLTCPAPIVAEAENAFGAQVSWPAIEVADADVVTDREPGGFVIGTTTVNAFATDVLGNESSCAFDVTVRDSVPPALSCPGDLSLPAMDETGAIADFTAHATDAVTATPELTYSVAPGTRLPLGETKVNARARDAAGNPSECTFTVKVEHQGCGCGATGAESMALVGMLAVAMRLVRRRA